MDGIDRVWDEVGTSAGTFECDGKHVEVVGIIFPLGDDQEETRHLTIPAAKALLIDLQDAITAALDHASK